MLHGRLLWVFAGCLGCKVVERVIQALQYEKLGKKLGVVDADLEPKYGQVNPQPFQMCEKEGVESCHMVQVKLRF